MHASHTGVRGRGWGPTLLAPPQLLTVACSPQGRGWRAAPRSPVPRLRRRFWEPPSKRGCPGLVGGPADPAEVALKSYSTGDTQNGKLGSLGTTGGRCLKGQVLRENIRGLSCSTVLLGCSYPVLSSWGCGTTEVRSLPSRSLRAKGSPGNDFSVESLEKSIRVLALCRMPWGRWVARTCPTGCRALLLPSRPMSLSTWPALWREDGSQLCRNGHEAMQSVQRTLAELGRLWGGNRSGSGETGRGPGAERGGCDRERAGGGVHGVPCLRAGGSAPASGSVGAEAGSGGPN